MYSLVKTSALAAILSITMATTAEAKQPDSNTTASSTPAQSQILIAQTQAPFRESRPYRNFIYERRMMDEMIMERMRMVGMAQEMLETTKDPGMRKMAQEIITSGNAEITRMLQMRRQMFLENPDKA